MGSFSQKENARKRKRFVILLCAVLAAVLVGSLALYGVIGGTNIRNPGQTGDPQDSGDFSGEHKIPETISASDRAETIFQDKDIINILLLGQDCWEYDGDSPQNTDAMIMCTINKKTGTLTMTSFLQDLWVYIPGHDNQRLNVPYRLGGFPLLNKTFDYNFGVSPDYNVEIDFSGFMEVIDLVGGVEIQLTEAEARYLNACGSGDVEADQNWQLREGLNLLNGSQTLAYSRIRKIGTDFARTNRQRMILTALVEKIKPMGSADLFDLSRKLLPLLRTDMSHNQILELIAEMLPVFPELTVVSQCIPMEQEYEFAKKSGIDVIVMNVDQTKSNKELIAATMGE